MVLCIIALPVFLFLSIFSAKYRPLARRAIDCVFKKVTLRKCETLLELVNEKLTQQLSRYS